MGIFNLIRVEQGLKCSFIEAVGTDHTAIDQIDPEETVDAGTRMVKIKAATVTRMEPFSTRGPAADWQRPPEINIR